jgi:hypothetical protein
MTEDTLKRRADTRRCGCCGRELPLRRLAELGVTPGVYFCRGCALRAARHAHGPTPLQYLSLLLRRPRPRGSVTRSVTPVLPSSDLDRTEVFYTALGFSTIGRKAGYLLMHYGPVELHFTRRRDLPRLPSRVHLDRHPHMGGGWDPSGSGG